MAVFLFTLYFLAAFFFLPRASFIRESGLSRNLIIGLFTVKIAAGCAVGLASHYLYHNTTDYDVYNNLGIAEYDMLFNDPYRFFTDIFHSNYERTGEFFGSAGSYWNDLRNNIIFKVLGLMNIFSRGNYYINSLFFNTFCFFGHVALFRVFSRIYVSCKWPLIIGCFLLPSLLYFSSGIQKDLITFTALGIFCYSLFFCLEIRFTAKRIFFLVFSFLVILAIRNFLAVILLPFASTWVLNKIYKLNPLKSNLVTLGVILVMSVLLHYTVPSADPLNVTVARQQSFLALGQSTTSYNIDTLKPTVSSFATEMPAALRRGYLSPYPGEFPGVGIQFFAVEMLVYVLLFFFLLKFHIRGHTDAFIVFGLFFSLLVLLFAGYITTSAGALIRYRSVFLPFIITPILAGIRWKDRDISKRHI